MNASPAAINLASQPFRRERARTALLAAVCSVLVLSLIVFTALIFKERRQASELRRTINGERSQLAQLSRVQAQFQGVIGKPGNADVFSKSVFYNELIARRAVSWTRVFEDLGKVMPYNVRLGFRSVAASPEVGLGWFPCGCRRSPRRTRAERTTCSWT